MLGCVPHPILKLIPSSTLLLKQQQVIDNCRHINSLNISGRAFRIRLERQASCNSLFPFKLSL